VVETARNVLIEKRFFVRLPDGELLPPI